MKKIDEALFKLLCWTCSGLMFSMMLLICVQVFFRYVLSASIPWSEELGRYIFIWMSFLGIVAVYYKGAHVAFDILPNKLTGIYKKVLNVLIIVLTIILAVAILRSGIVMVGIGTMQRSPALSLPMHMVFMVLPTSGALLLYFSIRKLYTTVFDKEVKQP
ncbi:MAG: TRAP transporter small permease [Defluviitaleaceae bacterium]|nr:TRAP transporter small permease [Defluviitaleaceae bacterium]